MSFTGEERICGVCGIPFTPTHPRQKYCSPSCKRKSQLKHYKEHEERIKQKHNDSLAARVKADERLSEKAGTHPADYGKRQASKTIEEFARIDLGDGEETHMKDDPIYDPTEMVDALKAQNEDLRAEFSGLKAENERLVAQLANINRASASQTLRLIKAILDVMEVEA